MLVNISKITIGSDVMKFNYKQLKQDRLCVYHIFDVYKIEEVFDVDGYDIFCKSKYESTDDETVVHKFHFDVFKVYNSREKAIVNLEPSLGDKLKYSARQYKFEFTAQEEAIETLKAQIDNSINKLLKMHLTSDNDGMEYYEIEL